jgi:ADP-ribose pyrophosphatase YjhB (NUDIX family)
MKFPSNSTVASGPVIIENGKVLLNKEQKPSGVTPWMFPGGEVEDFDNSLETACEREVGEEMGIKIKIIKPLKPILLHKDGKVIILIHYLAERIGEITLGKDTVEYGWHDINNLPKDCAPNVYEIIKDYTDALERR